MQVLLVGGDPGVLGSVKRFLEEENPKMRVVSVQRPEEALRLLSSEAFDCVVSDYTMPGMNGVELARRIRETSTVPFIIYKDRETVEVAEAAFDAGVDSFVRRIADPRHLLVLAKRVRLVVGRRRSEDLYRGVVERVRDPLWILVGTTIVHANEAMAELLGVDGPDEVMGHESTEWVVEEDRERVRETALGRQRGEAMPQLYEFTIQRRDGQRRRVEASASLISYMGSTASLSFLRDITERKKSEEELIRLADAVRMTTDSIMISGIDGKIIDVNEATLKMYGAEDRGELIGKSSFDLIALEDREKALAGMSEVLEKGYVESREYRILLKDGRETSVEMSVAILKGLDGNLMGFVGVSRDITDRKRLEEEMGKQRLTLEDLYENAPVMYLTLDTEGVIIKANQTMCGALGYAKEKLVGKEMCALLPEGDTQIFKDSFPRLLEIGGIRGALRRLVGKDGRVIETLMDTSVEYGEDGSPLYTRAVFRDMTTQREVERKLQESEEKILNFFDFTREGIIITNYAGIIESANSASTRILGYSKEELIGSPLNGLGFDPHQSQMMLNKLIKNDYIESYETVYKRKGGSFIDVLTSSFLQRDQNGSIVQIGTIFTDITERKRAERMMRTKLMKFSIEPGHIYVVKEKAPALALEAFKDLLNIGYQGVVISRTPENIFRKMVKNDFNFYWLAEKGERVTPPSYQKIKELVETYPRNAAFLIDGIEYLVLRRGFKALVLFIQWLRDHVIFTGDTAILVLDPVQYTERELHLLGKDAEEVNVRHPSVSAEMLEILSFVYAQNRVGVNPNYSAVGQDRNLSKPTLKKRINHLINSGYLTETPVGNNKLLHITETGRSMLFQQ